MRRSLLLVPALVVTLAVFTLTAGATWLAVGTGAAASRSTSVGKPTAVAATATGSSSVQVTWSPPVPPSPAPSSYDVFRYNGGTGALVCSVAAASPRVCNDTGLAPSTTYGYTVESRLGTNWLSGQTSQATATTNAAPAGTPNFLVALVTAGNKTAGTAFDVRVTARNGTTTDATYTGPHALTFSGPGNNGSPYPNPTYPTSGTFAAGVATVSVTLRKAETATLTVAEGARTGSTSITVVAGTATHLRYTSSTRNGTTDPAPCAEGGTVMVITRAGSWLSKVSRYDASGNPASGSPITISVTAGGGSGTLSVPASFGIAGGAQDTLSTFTYTVEDAGNPPAVTITAASSGLTSATCAVDR